MGCHLIIFTYKPDSNLVKPEVDFGNLLHVA
jgi:hypothetical protein